MSVQSSQQIRSEHPPKIHPREGPSGAKAQSGDLPFSQKLAQEYPEEQRRGGVPPTDFEGDELFFQMLTKFQYALTSFGEFRALPIKPRKCLLGKWMKEGDAGFVYGQRGA